MPTTLPLTRFYEEYMTAYQTHLRPFAVQFYQRKLAKMTSQEIDDEMDGLLGFREVFATLHEDHEEYSGPAA